MSSDSLFLIVGLVILIGYAGKILRQKTLVPESLFLVVFGLLLGPVLGVVPGEELLEFLPIVSIATMIVILIESGVNFDISKLRGSLQKASFFTILVAILTTSLVAGYLHFFLNWNFWHAAMLGLISSGTTTITSMSLLKSINVGNSVRRLILLETIINDFTLILGTFLIVEIIKVSSFSLQDGLQIVFSEFSIAIVAGIIFSYVWGLVLERIGSKRKLSYASTLGVCFILYFLSEYLGGNPIISIFTFSLLFGNLRRIFNFTKNPKDEADSLDPVIKSIKSVQENMTFFLAASFFVLLGITFDSSLLMEISPLVLAGIIAIILLVRYLSSIALSIIDKKYSRYKAIISIMIPRGYVAAVLAFIPAQEGVDIAYLTDIVVVLIIVTTLIAILGTLVYAYFNRKP